MSSGCCAPATPGCVTGGACANAATPIAIAGIDVMRATNKLPALHRVDPGASGTSSTFQEQAQGEEPRQPGAGSFLLLALRLFPLACRGRHAAWADVGPVLQPSPAGELHLPLNGRLLGLALCHLLHDRDPRNCP